MTFVEAAIEVLKREGKPLTIRRLAELAVKHNLLSVIGRDPEGTMLQRLDEAMARTARHPDLVRVKADTFGLRDYPPQPYPAKAGGTTAAAAGNGAPANGESARAEGAAAAAGEGAEKKRRRRRRGRRGEDTAGAAEADAGEETAEAAEDAAAPGTAAGAATSVAEAGAADEDAAEASAAGEGAAEAGEGAATGAGAAEAAPAAGGEKRRRRRRGGRGRRRREGEAPAAGDEAAGEGEEAEDEAEAAAEGAAAPAVAAEAGAGEAGAGEAGAGEAAAGEAAAGEAAAGEAAAEAGANGVAPRTMAAAAAAVPAAEAGEADVTVAAPADADVDVTPPIPDELPSEAEAAGTPLDAADEAAVAIAIADDAAAGEDAEVYEGYEELDADIDHATGPLLAPAHGAEDVTRTDDDRVVRPEIRGGRDDRHRRDRHRDRRDRPKDERRDHKAHDKPGHERHAPEKAAHGKPGHEKHAPARHAPEKHPPERHAPERHAPEKHAHERAGHDKAAPLAADTGAVAAGVTGRQSLIDAALEVLRGSDGRPMHARHIVENAVKRNLLDSRTPPADLIRLVRAALVRDLRERDAEGLRPRLRSAGGGHYLPADKWIEPDLVQVEKDLIERAARLREATRAALRRRLGRMTPGAFEAIGRTLCDKLGITGLELVRRGEGVTYWGGARAAGVGTLRTLVAFRAGEAEINRRSVGELRAGLAAKGFDEGLLLASGNPNAEALAELKNGSGVTLYDGAALAQLMVRHSLGVRRAEVPVDYLDLEFFAEITDG